MVHGDPQKQILSWRRRSTCMAAAGFGWAYANCSSSHKLIGNHGVWIDLRENYFDINSAKGASWYCSISPSSCKWWLSKERRSPSCCLSSLLITISILSITVPHSPAPSLLLLNFAFLSIKSTLASASPLFLLLFLLLLQLHLPHHHYHSTRWTSLS